MKDKKTPLTDALVKVAAWTHNTSVKKLGYSPLQLVTEKAVTIPGLTMGNEVIENIADSEAEQPTLEIIMKTIAEFCEADIRKKLKECGTSMKEILKKEIKFGFNQEMATHCLDLHLYFVRKDRACGCTVRETLKK